MTVRIERVEVVCLQDPQAPYYRFEGSYRNVVVIVQGDNGSRALAKATHRPRSSRRRSKWRLTTIWLRGLAPS